MCVIFSVYLQSSRVLSKAKTHKHTLKPRKQTLKHSGNTQHSYLTNKLNNTLKTRSIQTSETKHSENTLHSYLTNKYNNTLKHTPFKPHKQNTLKIHSIHTSQTNIKTLWKHTKILQTILFKTHLNLTKKHDTTLKTRPTLKTNKTHVSNKFIIINLEC